MREIDRELNRLERWEKAAATERAFLLSAGAVLATKAGPGVARRRVSQNEVSSYLADHPRAWPSQIAEALQVPTTNVSTHPSQGRHTRYERREDRWYLRAP
jgi:hypothetical protein